MARDGGPEALIVGLSVFALLAGFCLADIGFFDAGELASAAVGLGVPHPTGFPDFCLLGYAASLVPLGPIPFRLALLSAASIALATALVFATSRALGTRPLPALLGALAFPAVFVVWLHGTRIEVYALNAALIALLFYLLFQPRPRLGAAALVTGLGLGSHATFVLAAAVCWVIVLAARRGRDLRPGRLAALSAGFLAGAAVLAYLPVAAGRQPWLNWGDPASLGRLWQHLTASSIRSAYAGEMGNLSAAAWDRWLQAAGGPALALLLVLGLAGLHRLRPRAPLLAAAGIVAADAIFSVVLNPMGQSELQTGVPGALGASLLGAIGAAGLLHDAAPRWSRLFVPAMLVVALALSAFDRLADRRGSDLAGSYGRLALAETAPGALVFVSTDHLASQSLWLRGFEGFRSDVLVLVKQLLPEASETEAHAKAAGETLPEGWASGPPGDGSERLSRLASAAITRRPVWWELGDGLLDGPFRAHLEPTGLLYRLRREPLPRGAANEATLTDSLAPFDAAARRDFRARRVLSDAARHRGVWHLFRGELEPGARAFEAAVALDDTNPPALANLAAARRRQGRLDEAIALLERAVAIAPDYEKGWANLAAYRQAAGGAR